MICKLFFIFSLLIINSPQAVAKSTTIAATTNATTDPLSSKSDLPAPANKELSSGLVELNFQNASISSVLDYLAQQKGLNIVPAGKDLADKKISMATKDQMSLTEAWDALMTLMELQGYRLVKFGKLYKVMAIKDAGTEAMRVYSSAEGDTWRMLPDSGDTVTFIYYLTNMKADQASTVISAFIGDKPIVFSDLDICIIRGPCYKIRAALEIIETFDKDQLKQTIKILKLKYTNPDTVAKLISEDIAGSKGQDQQRIRFISSSKKEVSFLSPSVKLISDPNQGTLIMLGQERQIQKICDFIEKFIDVEWGGDKTRVKIKEVKYRGADDLQKTLDRIIKSTNQGANKQQGFKDLKIVAETAQGGSETNYGSGNRLIVACDPEDWIKLNALIENLDNLKPQIALEIMIIDASLALARALQGHIRDTGVGILGKNVGWAVTNIGAATDIRNSWTSLGDAISGSIANTTGDSMVTFGDSTKPNATGLWGLIRSTFQVNNSNIISQPFIVVNNGEQCIFTDQENRRTAGELSSRGQVQVQKQETASATNTVTVTPRINSDGIVDIKLNISIEEFTDILTGQAPDKSTRAIDTKVCMSVGEVLVLGGLSRNKRDDTKYSTPFFEEIPIIGNFARAKTKVEENKTLFIFIRPSLIKPRAQVEPDDYTQFKLDYAKLNIKRTDDLAAEKDPISKVFFKPEGMTVAQVTQNSKSEIYPPIDEFSQRKKMPLLTDIKRDTYYRVTNKDSLLLDQKTNKKKKYKKPPAPDLLLKKRQLITEI